MKYTLAYFALSGLVSAASLPRDSCSCKFTLTASGGQSGTVGQLSDGQNRIGGGNPTGSYCINTGQITDSQGRGCILTPPTTQLQCDVGATPTGGFSLGSNGQVEYNGSTKFHACPASDNQYNIYTTPVAGQTKCVEISLTASDCYAKFSSMEMMTKTSIDLKTSTVMVSDPTSTVAKTAQESCPAPQTKTETIVKSAAASCPAPGTSTMTVVKTAEASCPAPSTITITAQANSETKPANTPSQSKPTNTPSKSAPNTESSKTASAATSSSTASHGNGKSCPANLSGSYQYPHLITPISKSHPNTAYGTSYNGTITSDISSIFNFDIPASYAGKTCSLVFLFPEQKDLETSSYSFSGDGVFKFEELSVVATSATTYANQGGVKADLGDVIVAPGGSYVVASGECPAGKAVSYEIESVSGSSLSYFQDYNPSPIGLYVVAC